MTALGRRPSQLVQLLSDIRGDISRLSSESSALVELNKSTRLAVADINRGTQTVADTMADFLRSVEASDNQHRQALEASEIRNRQALAAYRSSFEQSLKDIIGVHAKAMDDMQSKVKSSFDRMKYLEKTFAGVPERITNHLDVQLPTILTDVVGKAITPTLAAVLTESLPPTMASVLEGSFSDFQTRFDSAVGADSTIHVWNLLEAATDSRVKEHMAVITAIKGIDQRLSVLDELIATSDASAESLRPDAVTSPGPTPAPSRADPRPAGAAYMPVPPTWGHGFQPSVTAPAPAPPPSSLRVDTSSLPILGGKIKTPRSTDPAWRARTMKTSRFDLAGLADTGYHIGDFGVDTLTELIISNCGYQTFHVDHPEDVLLCFQEIINIHRVVVQTWTNTRTHFSGPVVEYILENALPVFPCMHDLDVSGMVKFYDGLQKISMRYLLPLMPFDSIRLAFGYEGLCPPGLGTTRYSAIVSAWMDVLPRLLPQKEPLVESAIFSVSVESNNGFDLLWRVLEIAVPGFKSMNPVQVPSWTPQTDVLSFCWEHLLYFRLQSKHNMFFSARTQTNIFLRNIQLSEYADVVTTLQSQVNAYMADDDDGYLPANLCINGIATAMHMNALARVRDAGFAPPRVRRVAGDWDSTLFPPVPDAELPLCVVQGYSPRAFRVEQGQDRFSRTYDRDGFSRTYDQDGPAGRGGRGFDRDKAGRGRRDFDRDGRRPSPRDRSIRPDLRRRSFVPGVQCDACKGVGHEASSCDMLAIALFLDKYVKHSLSDDVRHTIESTWVARWKEKLGQPQRSPSQVMKAYCDNLDISPGHLDLAMDWDCWPVDEYGDFTQDLHYDQE
jgi:hypothetical protein